MYNIIRWERFCCVWGLLFEFGFSRVISGARTHAISTPCLWPLHRKRKQTAIIARFRLRVDGCVCRYARMWGVSARELNGTLRENVQYAWLYCPTVLNMCIIKISRRKCILNFQLDKSRNWNVLSCQNVFLFILTMALLQSGEMPRLTWLNESWDSHTVCVGSPFKAPLLLPYTYATQKHHRWSTSTHIQTSEIIRISNFYSFK